MAIFKSIAVVLAALRSVASFTPSKSYIAPKHKISTSISSTPRSLVQLSQQSFDEDPFDQEEYREDSYQPPAPQPQRQDLDPLVAALTRIDETASPNTPTTIVPILGEVPADGNLALLAPAAGIAVLGFIFSIVVAFNARDAIVQELSAVELPKMEYTPTVVEEGVCRGLCSSQESDLEGLRGFMNSLAK